MQYTPPLTTLCFMCTCEANGLVSWTVQGKQVGPESGKVLSNGTLLIPNSSQAFSTNMPTLISCTDQERCNHTFPVLLVGESLVMLATLHVVRMGYWAFNHDSIQCSLYYNYCTLNVGFTVFCFSHIQSLLQF